MSTGHDNKLAAVTVSGSRITVALPKVWVRNLFLPADTMQVSGSLTLN